MRLFLSFVLSTILFQTFANKESSLIYQDVQKLNSLKKVLYIAAHPDDENTRALAWFSLSEHAETAYLSLTRGDGGQNLIGEELSEDLGVLRTQELLAARSYDGAQQYFSKAVDFGYSKSAKETFDLWGKDLILADVVLMIRKFQPDVIITRFPPDERAGHGHHTASAILALEAFKLAADPNYLPEQVAEYGTWKTTAIYWNASNWWNKDLDQEAANNPNYLVKDIGSYSPILGKSYNEVGTLARSQHKCQGFGAILERGSRIEYFEYMDGEKLKEDFFEKNTKSWDKLIDKSFQQKMDALLQNFDFKNPASNVPSLLDLKQKLEKLPKSSFKNEKLQLINQIIIDCLGIYGEILGEDYAFTLNEEAELTLNLINRSAVPVVLKSVGGVAVESKLLERDAVVSEKINFKNEKKVTTPYWLELPFKNVFSFEDKSNALMAENKATFTYEIELSINGATVQMDLPVSYKWSDPSYGERRRAAISTPDFALNFNEKSIILQEGQEKRIEIKIQSFKDNLKDTIVLEAPKGWRLSQSELYLDIKKKHESYFAEIVLSPSEGSVRGNLQAKNLKGEAVLSYTEIAYDHIPTQVIFKEANLTCVTLDAKIKRGKICYVKGAEDLVPQAIAQLGFEVDVVEVDDLSSLDLGQYQTVVLGIRIYNVHEQIRNFENKLFQYVEEGGNIIMQYNTASRSQANLKFGGPLSFEISRNRVTDENAPVLFLQEDHPILNSPNKISLKDFDDWVQERGLYFASNWDEKYTPLFSWQDEGEDPQLGALIVASHGKGQIVYTGISFFRELPNGVEGAYRLFANLLSYESK